jgi:hypothetical protein
MTATATENPFVAALRSLPAAGSTGFEGLLREIFSATTGQAFRLVKSGPQGGLDAISDRAANLLEAAIECKRYGPDTYLGLDELKAKIADAASSYPSLDLWVLATTREIDGTDQRAMREWGESFGIAVEVLDWPKSNSALPPLSVLAAANLELTCQFLKADEQVRQYLTRVSVDPGFTRVRDQVIARLTAADVGYASARCASTKWLRHSMTDLGSAKAQLRSHANLLDSKTHRVPRPHVDEFLDKWLEKENTRVAALLGAEGLGKTWALLSWWNLRAGVDDQALPLTVVLPAMDVTEADAETLIASALAKRTSLRTIDFWQRRVKRWFSRSGDRPKILLIIDGLDEHWSFKHWSTLIQPLLAGERRGQFAVALTCRPDHWKSELKSLIDLEPKPREFSISEFDDKELDLLLALHQQKRAEFPETLVKLMRVPRLCHLAIELRTAVSDTADVTAERLIYEDWKRRLERRGARISLGDSEFRELVSSFGTQLRSALADNPGATPELRMTRGELLAKLGRNSGSERQEFVTTLSELVDGRWLHAIEGQSHRFALQPSMVPFALGLALVDDLKSNPQIPSSSRLAVFLDPLRGQDSASEILRAATTVAVVDPTCSESLRQCLVEAWVTAQHFRESDFEAYWRLIGLRPETFFENAFAMWTRLIGGSHIDEVLIKGFANAAERPFVLNALKIRVEVWLGTYWTDPYVGAFLNDDEATPKSEERRLATANRLQRWNELVRDQSTLSRVAIRTSNDPRGTSWAIHRIFGILSFLPRATFVQAMVNWAVSRAVMGISRHEEEMSWLLRHNQLDALATENALHSEIVSLLGVKSPLSRSAAEYLIRAVASKSAMALLPAPQEAPTNEGKIGLLRLARVASDPGYELSEVDKAQLNRAIGIARSTQLWKSRNEDRASVDFKALELALSRWAPDELAQVVRQTFDTVAQRTPEGRWRLSTEVPEHLIIMDTAQRDALISQNLFDQAAEETLKTVILGAIALLKLQGASSTDQIKVYANPEMKELPAIHASLLQPPTISDFEQIASHLAPERAKEQLLRWLNYLRNVQLTAMPPGYPPICRLLTHGDAVVRRVAIEVALDSNDRDLKDSLLDSGWQTSSDMDRSEAIYGSLVLCGASSGRDAETLRAISHRILPEALGHLLLANPQDAGVLDRFSLFVKDEIDAVLTRRSRSVRQLRIEQAEPIELLASLRLEEMAKWVQPIVSHKEHLWDAALFEGFPLMDICRSLLVRSHPVGAQLWKKMFLPKHRGRFRLDAVSLLVLESPSGAVFDETARMVLDRIALDRDLALFVRRAEAKGHTDWLIAQIEKDIDAATCGPAARAVALAGALDCSPAADRLWSNRLAAPPSHGWLATVFENAKESFERNRQARHWLKLFVAEMDCDRAFGQFRLFAKCADGRVENWAHQIVAAGGAALPRKWKEHWQLMNQSLNGQINQRAKVAEGTLYGTKALLNRQAPWL